MTGARTIALFDKAGLLTTRDLLRLSRALNIAGQHRAQHWGFGPPVFVIRRDESRLQDGEMALVFVTDLHDDPGALAVHYWDGSRGEPAGRVYVDRASGLGSGSYSVCEAASHELEALSNERLNQWRQHPGRAGVDVALETDDPTQDTYEITVPDEMGRTTTWPVSNFVLPAWFRPQGDMPERYDYAGRFTRPGEIGPEGYAVMRGYNAQGRREIWFEDRDGQRFMSAKAFARAPGKHSVLVSSRTQRLLAQAV